MTTTDNTITPPLLTLPPVLLTHILLHLEAHEIICTQALLTRHPALACLEDENLWALVLAPWMDGLEQGRMPLVLPAERFFALHRPRFRRRGSGVRIIFYRSDGTEMEEGTSMLIQYKRQATRAEARWQALVEAATAWAFESQGPLTKARFLDWATLFSCAGGCGAPGSATRQCCGCGDFVCGQPACAFLCAARCGGGPCPFTLCPHCFAAQQRPQQELPPEELCLDRAPLLLRCGQCPPAARRCACHGPAGTNACVVCRECWCSEHVPDGVKTCYSCKLALCSGVECTEAARGLFTPYVGCGRWDRAFVCQECTETGRGRPFCHSCPGLHYMDRLDE